MEYRIAKKLDDYCDVLHAIEQVCVCVYVCVCDLVWFGVICFHLFFSLKFVCYSLPLSLSLRHIVQVYYFSFAFQDWFTLWLSIEQRTKYPSVPSHHTHRERVRETLLTFVKMFPLYSHFSLLRLLSRKSLKRMADCSLGTISSPFLVTRILLPLSLFSLLSSLSLSLSLSFSLSLSTSLYLSLSLSPNSISLIISPSLILSLSLSLYFSFW